MVAWIINLIPLVLLVAIWLYCMEHSCPHRRASLGRWDLELFNYSKLFHLLFHFLFGFGVAALTVDIISVLGQLGGEPAGRGVEIRYVIAVLYAISIHRRASRREIEVPES